MKVKMLPLSRNIKCIMVTVCMLAPILHAQSQTDTVDVYGYNLIELSKIKVTSATKSEQTFNEIPATVHVITRKEIREHAYFTLDEALACLPGFQFRNTLGYNSYVFQRGVPSQNNLILVLIDGVQVNELNSGGFYSGAQYNLENVEQIEVVYGPASVIYGTNAVSGIINIVTQQKPGLEASLLGGNFRTRNINLSYGHATSNLGARVSGMYKNTEKADLRGDNCDNNWTDEMENYETDYSFDANVWYKNISASVNFLNKRTPVSTFYPSVGTIYRDHGTLWNIMFFNAHFKHKHQFSDKLHLTTTLYNRNATTRNNTIFKITDTAQVGYYRPNHLLGAESIVEYTFKQKLKLVTGLMLETEQIAEGYSITYSQSPDEAPPIPDKPNMLANQLLSLFAESQLHIAQEIELVAGLRFDNSSVYHQVFTPRMSIIYNHKYLNSKLIYAQAFRAPKPWDYSNGLGNPDLQPETMNSFEWFTTTSSMKSIKLSLSIYKNILDGAIIKEILGDGDEYRWINYGKVETDGLEILLNYSRKNINFLANYTFNHSYDENKSEVTEIAKHSANATFTYSFYKHFKINLRANYFGKRKNPQLISATDSFYTEPALIFNGVLSMINYHKFDFQIIAKNLLNTEYYHTSNRLVERYRQPQRTILLKIAYRI